VIGRVALAFVLAAQASSGATSDRAAWRVVDLDTTRILDESHADRIEQPTQPGSFMKLPTLVAALASHTISPDTRVACPGQAIIDGHTIRCSHPRVRHALRPAEALALSCNIYFATIGLRLPRARLDGVLTALGLPSTPPGASMALAATGLAANSVRPTALLAAMTQVVRDPDALGLDAPQRQVVYDGLRGSAVYGTSGAFALKGVEAYAKTGTADATGGGVHGLVVALWPARRPTYGIVLVAPGVAGRDAADLAATIAAQSMPGAKPVQERRPQADRVAAPAAAPTSTAATAAGDGLTIRVGFPRSGGGYDVRSIPLEEYVTRVLAGEAAPRSPAAALQALAITARTFALANRGRHRRDGFDLCTLTHCQVLREPTEAMRAAVLATSGRVLEWQGMPAQVFYTASCGGYSERPSAVWPGAADPPFLKVHRDRACDGEPHWASEIPVRDLERALKASGFRGSLRDLKREGRTASGRVERLRLPGLAPDQIGAQEFRTVVGRVLGWNLIKSTDFSVRRRGTGFYFEGHGFGHGVGLCVLGSARRAEAGQSAGEILKAYFPGLSVRPWSATAVSATPAPVVTAPLESGEVAVAERPERRPSDPEPAVPPAPSPAGSPTPSAPPPSFALVLPSSYESDRVALRSSIERVLQSLTRATGEAPPSNLQIVFHPSAASFQRETGESWWSAARTRDRRIDLLPPAVLRDRGTLDVTIRHELAHVLTSSALNGRAEWVQEGAAMHFAGELPPQSLIGPDGIPRRVHCPSDADLRRPTSAALARQAYGLAAACFERALAENGGAWKEVR
jgi:SpoIID/LytB domain protein